MIVAWHELAALASTVAMVDGGFDPLHAGHIAYFREAATLGVPVLCNVASDDWVQRKHVPILPQAERVQVIDAIRWISYTHASASTTATVIRELRPRYYVKGGDWRGRLPDAERSLCEELGVEIVYLETVTNSSSALVRRFLELHERNEGGAA